MTTTSLRFVALTIAIMLSCVSAVAQPDKGACDINFAPETVKPSQIDSFKTLLASFHPKGQTQRLSDLQAVIQDLGKAKSELADTLAIVSTADNLESWQKSRLKQIPEMQNRIVDLFRKVSDESKAGGLFAGSPVVGQLKVMISAKAVQLRLLCSTSYAPLPLRGDDKKQLDKVIADIRAETTTLGEIDKKIGELITKAQEEQDKANKKS